MKLSDFKKIAQVCITADVPCRVWGPGGIGKSQLLQQLAEELGMNFEDLRLATQEVGDLIGLPEIIVMGDDKHVTSWAQPSWLAKIWTLHHQGVATILALEEKARAPKEVTQAAFQILTEKKLHQYELPPDCRLFALDNPPTEEYQVTPADRAENTRWANVYVTADAIDWIENYGVLHASEELTAFIAGNKEALCAKDKKQWNVETVIYNVPRTWVLADRIWKTIKPNLDPDDEGQHILLLTAIGACVGSGPATLFVDSLVNEWVSMEELLTGEKTYEDVRDKPELRVRAFHQFLHFLDDKDLLLESGQMDKERITRFGEFIVGLDSEGYRDLSVSLLKKFMSKKTTEGKSSNIVKMLFKYGPKSITKLVIDTGNDISNSNEDY